MVDTPGINKQIDTSLWTDTTGDVTRTAKTGTPNKDTTVTQP